MPKLTENWNRFYADTNGTNIYTFNTNVAPAGAIRSQAFNIGGMSSLDFAGELMKTMPFQDGRVSMALRSTATEIVSDMNSLGVFLRCPTLMNGAQSLTNMDFYIAGIYRDGTDATCNMRCYRVLDGSATQMGSQWTVPVVDNQFIQFEFRAVNDGSGDVILERRHNAGSSISKPGSTNWTSFTTITTDTGHGGVLNQSGYSGMIRYAGTSITNTSQQKLYYVANFRSESE